MATEKLVIELDAKMGDLEAGLDRLNKKLDETEGNTGKADNSFKKFSKTAVNVGTATAKAFVAAGSALSAFIVLSAKSQRELEILARQAKLSTEEFEALAFATSQYGINAEQIADISKDLSDKLGEFASVGTGAFQDVADVLGITTEEARILAIQMEDMSGDQVIGELVKRMEDAGATTNEMTFALESMGSDLSKLLPLFSGNSAELKTLEGRYTDATKSMKLTNEEANALKGAATSFDLLTSSLGDMAEKVSATLAPTVTGFFTELTSIIPLVTSDLIDFINTFLDAEDKIQKPKPRAPGTDGSGKIVPLLTGGSSDDGGGNSSGGLKPAETAALELEKRMKAFRIQAEADEAKRQAEIDAAEVERIKDRFKTDITLAEEKFQREQDLLSAANESTEGLQAEHDQRLKDLEADRINEMDQLRDEESKRKEDRIKSEEKIAENAAKNSDRMARESLNIARSINTDLLNDNKEVGAGIIIADTAIGITKAYAQGGIFGTASAIAIAASGAAQLANLQSASRGGGSSGVSAAPEIPESTGGPETSDLSLSASDVSGGSSQFVIRFEGNGDEITQAIAKNMVVMNQDGTLQA